MNGTATKHTGLLAPLTWGELVELNAKLRRAYAALETHCRPRYGNLRHMDTQTEISQLRGSEVYPELQTAVPPR